VWVRDKSLGDGQRKGGGGEFFVSRWCRTTFCTGGGVGWEKEVGSFVLLGLSIAFVGDTQKWRVVPFLLVAMR